MKWLNVATTTLNCSQASPRKHYHQHREMHKIQLRMKHVAGAATAVLFVGACSAAWAFPRADCHDLQGCLSLLRTSIKGPLVGSTAQTSRSTVTSRRLNSDADQAYISMCAVVKDQNDDIREWVKYHHWLGVNKFYIHDHNSSKPVIQELQDWVDAGLVEYHRLETKSNTSRYRRFNATPQGHAYKTCLDLARSKHTWMAFIDIDEFIVLNDPNQKLPDIAKDFESYGGLLMQWRLFSSSGHVEKPSQPTMLAYTKCMSSAQVKSLVNVQLVSSIANNPHVFLYKPGYYGVTDTKERCDRAFCPVAQTRLALHHYVLKSEAEYRQKRLRGGGAGGVKHPMFWQSIESGAKELCLQAFKAARMCFGVDSSTAGSPSS